MQYTHFFSPLKDDGKPIDLRRFYQHPSTISAGLAFFDSSENDKTGFFETDTKTTASMLLLGGELYLPTNTGFFLNIGAGSGTTKENIGGTAQPEVDLGLGRFELGVRQYIGQSFAIHLRLDTESVESKPAGFDSTTSDRSLLLLGARGVISDLVGLAFEIGGGKREDETMGLTTKYDLAAVNFEIAGYFGKQFSARLALAAETQDLQDMAPGFEHTTTTGRTTLAAKYWFSERFGMELPLYWETIEHKTVYPGGEFADRTTNSGLGLYAAIRF